MSKVVEFLNEAKTYYLATVYNGEAKIRPIGAAVEYNGRVYLATNNQKEMYKQMLVNPSISVSGMSNGKWIRITGKAVMDTTVETKTAMLEAHPMLKHMYSVEDEAFTTFYIDDMKAVLNSFGQEPVELEN